MKAFSCIKPFRTWGPWRRTPDPLLGALPPHWGAEETEARRGAGTRPRSSQATPAVSAAREVRGQHADALTPPRSAGTRRGEGAPPARHLRTPSARPAVPPCALAPLSEARSTWRDGARRPEGRDTTPIGGERPPAASVRGREGHTRLPGRRDALAAEQRSIRARGGRSSRQDYRAYELRADTLAAWAEHTSWEDALAAPCTCLLLLPTITQKGRAAQAQRLDAGDQESGCGPHCPRPAGRRKTKGS